MRIAKKVITWALFLWLVAFLIASFHVPGFHKQPPENPVAVTLQKQPGAEERIRCIDGNQEALIRRLQMIESAQKELILSTYYLGNDNSGNDVMSALFNAAERGVHIRILVDGFSGFLSLRNSDTFKALTESPLVEAKIYNPVNILLPWKLNYRMHDKYMIIDQQLYILGGRNTKDVSLGNYPGKHDVDRDILVWGRDSSGSVRQVLNYFEEMWRRPECRPVTMSKTPHTAAKNQLLQRYEDLQNLYPQAFEGIDFRELTIPVESITLLTNPQEAENKVPVLWSSLVKLMQDGRDIQIQTPYIICNRQMYRDLHSIAQGEENFKIITNAPETGANPCGCADYRNNVNKLRKTGAELWEYAADRSSHSKSIVIDDRISIVGSFNFDMRSTYLDTEMMLVIESPELNHQLRDINGRYLENSRCILPSGEVLAGECYTAPQATLPHRLLQSVLRFLIPPVRHLL